MLTLEISAGVAALGTHGTDDVLAASQGDAGGDDKSLTEGIHVDDRRYRESERVGFEMAKKWIT